MFKTCFFMNPIRKLAFQIACTTLEYNSQFEFDVLIPSGHECAWVNRRVASHMLTWAMRSEQCMNAQVVHVCNALCADVYVCAPLCTCSAVVHLGLHAKCTLIHCACVFLNLMRASKIQFANCVWTCKCICAWNSYIVFGKFKFWIDFEKRADTVVWTE